MSDFDVIVIGTGVAGQTAAQACAVAGKRTAIVDRREFGGTCALRGCEPKKVLFTGAEPVERMRAQAGHGPRGDAALDWGELIAFKRTFTDPVTPSIEKWLADAGVELIRGEARFAAPGALEIGTEIHGPEAIVLATGAKPRDLGIPGADLVTDSERFMELDEMPRRVVFVGGGYVSFEFAHMAAAAGAEVSIVHRSTSVLKGFDTELAAMLAQGYRDRGIAVRLDSPVSAIEREGDGLVVRCGSGDDIACDLVVHGAGRVPDLDALDLEAGGIAAGRRGVEVDERMRSTSDPRVFAVGDAADRGAPLTPVGIAAARVAARNIVEPGSAVFDPAVVPTVAFASPPLASVGMTEQAARAAGREIEVKLSQMTDWASQRRVGATVAAAKVVVEATTDKILGATLLCHNAEEVVNVFAVAIASGATAADMRDAIWAYPTVSSEIGYLV